MFNYRFLLFITLFLVLFNNITAKNILLSVEDARDFYNSMVELPQNYNSDWFDIKKFGVLSENNKLVFKIDFFDIGNPWKSSNGFSAQVIDIFITKKNGGNTNLTDLNIKTKTNGWHEHIRINGFDAFHYSYNNNLIEENQKPIFKLQDKSITVKTNIKKDLYLYWIAVSIYSPFESTSILKPNRNTSFSFYTPNNSLYALTAVDVISKDSNNLVFDTKELDAIGELEDNEQYIRLMFIIGLVIFIIGFIVNQYLKLVKR